MTLLMKEQEIAEENFNKGMVKGIEEGKAKGIEEGMVKGIEEGKAKGIEEGKVKGVLEEKVEIAKKSIGVLDDNTISLITGLSLEEKY